MYNIVSKLIIYGDMDKDSILMKLSDIIRKYKETDYKKDEIITELYCQVKRILEVSTDYGFDDNLWHNYLTYLLISNENAYSRACEIRGNIEGSINEIALHDFEVFRYFFEFDLEDLGRKLGVDCIPVLLHYERFEGNVSVT